MITGATWRTVSALLSALALTLPLRADVGSGDSSLFTVDARYGLSLGGNSSGRFIVDTRLSGNAGRGDSDPFTTDTRAALVASAVISGRVTDTGNSVLPDTAIKALQNGIVKASAACDSAGNYQLPLLPPGTYEVRATRAGYISGVKRGLTFNAGQSGTVNFSLAPRAAPAVTQPVTRQAPPNPFGPPTPDQLKVWNGSQFVTGASLATDKITIVLTHGWNSSSADWPQAMAAQLTTGPGSVASVANIVAWDWANIAHTTILLGAAWSQVPSQGEALGMALAQSLPGYTKPVHFIGHSLGSMVNAGAANYVHQHAAPAFVPARTHMTTMDNAVAANIGGPVLDTTVGSFLVGPGAVGVGSAEVLAAGRWVSAFPDNAAWMDNYISEVGYPSGKAVNVCLSQGALFAGHLGLLLDALHGYAHEWYGATVTQPQSSLLGHRYSYERLGESAGLSASYPYAPGTWFEQASTVDQLSLRQLSSDEVVICQTKIARATAQATWSGFATIVNGAMQTLGNVATSVVEKTRGVYDEALSTVELSIESVPRVNLTAGLGGLLQKSKGRTAQAGGATNIPAYAWFTVAIPSNVSLMTFDFQLSGDPRDDCLAFGINGTNQFVLPGRFIPVDVEQNSGYLDVAKWAGQNVEFFFGVIGGTSTNASLTVDGIRFYQLVPPALQVARAGNQATVAWPISAPGFVLESAAGLTGTNQWSAVTNAFGVADFQYTVTNDASGVRFFRLRNPGP